MALSTAQDLIDSALRLLGVVDQEGTPTTTQRNQGLDALNAIIDSMVLDGLLVYRHDDEQVTIAAASTTWGAAGTITTARPLQILSARRVDSATSEPGIRVLNINEYRARSDKSTTGSQITDIAYDPSYALGMLYALGATSGTLKITSLKPWTQYSALSTSLGLPPGYVRFMRHALTAELSPEYGMPPPQASMAFAEDVRTQLGRINVRNKAQKAHNSFSMGGVIWDINTDDN